MQSATDALKFRHFLNCRIRRVRRIFYVHRGDIDKTNGPIELSFDERAPITFDSGSNGQDLAVGPAWVDPFAEPLSAENRAFVEECGKWTAFDVSDEPLYRDLVGATVRDVSVSSTARGAVVARIVASAATISLDPDGDEMTVVIEPSSDR